jgi:hypothetical protein
MSDVRADLHCHNCGYKCAIRLTKEALQSGEYDEALAANSCPTCGRVLKLQLRIVSAPPDLDEDEAEVQAFAD